MCMCIHIISEWNKLYILVVLYFTVFLFLYIHIWIFVSLHSYVGSLLSINSNSFWLFPFRRSLFMLHLKRRRKELKWKSLLVTMILYFLRNSLFYFLFGKFLNTFSWWVVILQTYFSHCRAAEVKAKIIGTREWFG